MRRGSSRGEVPVEHDGDLGQPGGPLVVVTGEQAGQFRFGLKQPGPFRLNQRMGGRWGSLR